MLTFFVAQPIENDVNEHHGKKLKDVYVWLSCL